MRPQYVPANCQRCERCIDYSLFFSKSLNGYLLQPNAEENIAGKLIYVMT